MARSALFGSRKRSSTLTGRERRERDCAGCFEPRDDNAQRGRRRSTRSTRSTGGSNDGTPSTRSSRSGGRSGSSRGRSMSSSRSSSKRGKRGGTSMSASAESNEQRGRRRGHRGGGGGGRRTTRCRAPGTGLFVPCEDRGERLGFARPTTVRSRARRSSTRTVSTRGGARGRRNRQDGRHPSTAKSSCGCGG